MIMTLSMKKIVESRSRRGGASLHRNLLVAGVLFKARDLLLTAADDSADDPPSSDDHDADPPAADENNRKSCDEEDERMDCERTGARDVGKENVPPSDQTADHSPRCDDVQPSSRGGKRPSRDAADDDATPCKTTRADATDCEGGGPPSEPAMDVDEDVFRQTWPSSSSSSCPAVASLSVVRWQSSVIRLPCLDGRLQTQNVTAEPALVRPLLVVQVV